MQWGCRVCRPQGYARKCMGIQTMADQTILIYAMLPASLMPLLILELQCEFIVHWGTESKRSHYFDETTLVIPEANPGTPKKKCNESSTFFGMFYRYRITSSTSRARISVSHSSMVDRLGRVLSKSPWTSSFTYVPE